MIWSWLLAYYCFCFSWEESKKPGPFIFFPTPSNLPHMCFPSLHFFGLKKKKKTEGCGSFSICRIHLSKTHQAKLLDLSFLSWFSFKPNTLSWLIKEGSEDFLVFLDGGLLGDSSINNPTLPPSLHVESVSLVQERYEVIWTVLSSVSSSDLVWEELPVRRLRCRLEASWETAPLRVNALYFAV